MKKIVLFLISISFLHGTLVSTRAQEGYTLNLVGSLNTGITYDVHVDGNIAYLTNNQGVDILDISDISNPKKISTIHIQDGAFGIYVEGDVAYIAGETGLTITDVGDPEHPEIIGSFYDGGVNRNVRIRGSYAYVTDYEDGLEIVDISDLSNPVMVGRYSLGDTRGVEVAGDIAYVTSPGTGLRVLNISNPADPEMIKRVTGTGSAANICVHDDRIYLGCYTQGVRIASITDPLNPKVTGDFSAGIREASGVYGDEDLLFVVDQTRGGDVILLDVSDLEAPRELARYPNLNAHDVFYDGNFGYIATVNQGMYILEYGPEGAGSSPRGGNYTTPLIALSILAAVLIVYRVYRR
jgi:hypothetical protein